MTRKLEGETNIPPRARTTKEEILNTILEITKEIGPETVSVRSTANKLQYSIRPIFTCCENMDEVRKDFFNFVYKYYEQFVISYRDLEKINFSLAYSLLYTEFARDETCLSKFLFIDDMDLSMSKVIDFYKEEGNKKRANDFPESIGIRLEKAKTIFLDLFLCFHGITVLTAMKKMKLDKDNAQKTVINVLFILIKQEKSDWHLEI